MRGWLFFPSVLMFQLVSEGKEGRYAFALPPSTGRLWISKLLVFLCYLAQM